MIMAPNSARCAIGYIQGLNERKIMEVPICAGQTIMNEDNKYNKTWRSRPNTERSTMNENNIINYFYSYSSQSD